MKKRWTAALLALFLAAALLPAPAWAADAADGSAGSRLTGMDREIYDYLQAEIVKIAAGSRTSTEIKVPDLKGLSWPVSELGVTGDRAVDIQKKLEEKLDQSVNLDRIYSCLAADLAYELFWKDNQYSWGYSLTRLGSTASIKSLTLRIQVSQDYRGGSSTTTSPSKISGANEAAKNAQAIVDKYRDKSDYEKLTAYREEICRLVSYNNSAAGNGVPYGNPWQLIYVFDGDPSTNVVCEGYAKAFKYLCDLSDFDGDVACRIATGTMGTGGHMWNVVRMGDGKNYLVDVTNCDSGTIGADDKLFLAGAAESDGGQTYTVSKGSCRAVYSYSEDEAGLYADGWLALSGEDYVDVPGAAAVKDPPLPGLSFQDVDPEEYYAQPVAWAVEREITNGTSETAFSPDQTCTHGQILTFLWRAAGEPSSSGEAPEGVTAADYYYSAVRWASSLGMLGEDFDPEADCSRMDAVWYIWLAFGGPGYMVATGFTDLPDPADSPYAWAVGWALLEGVTTGTSDTTFEPETICSRGQIVTFLYRAYH